MNTRYKLIALSALLAGVWSAAPLAQTANPPNANSSATGGSGSGVVPRTTGGSAMPSSENPGMKKPSLSRSAAAGTTTAPAATGMSSGSGTGSTTAMASGGTARTSAAPARKPKKDRG